MICRWCQAELVEVDNPMRREVRHRRGTECVGLPARGANRHGEAYCLMTYRADDGSAEERIWNSRDGVTPFVISLRSGATARHVDWSRDSYAPNHQPRPGDRLFIDLTEERHRRMVFDSCARYWLGGIEADTEHGREARATWASAGAMAADLMRDEPWRPGLPALIEWSAIEGPSTLSDLTHHHGSDE